MNRNPTAAFVLTGLAAALIAGGPSFGGYRPREFTLDEEEAQSARRMLNRARARRRAMERAEITERELAAAREAAAKEAARPKSRQELRARERAMLKRGSQETPPTKFGRVVAKDKSESLKRILDKKRR